MIEFRGKIKGDILISVLVFAAISVTMIIGLTNWGATLIMSARMAVQSEQAFQIAEAGLNHYTDAVGVTQYTHDFSDKDGKVIGSYSLLVVPPVIGSTKTIVTSKGIVPSGVTSPNGSTISRTVQAVMLVPTFAQYPLISTSTTDFSVLGSEVNQLQSIASSSGYYYPQSQHDDGSGDNIPAYGYHLVLNQDKTFTLYTVTALVSAPYGCSGKAAGWDTWSIQSQVFSGTYSLPAQGLIFFQDNVWVDGTLNGSRLTIVANNITVNADLIYTKYDGSDSLGLIAQNNINIGLISSNDLHIDGALLSENGRVGRYRYGSNCRIDGQDFSRRTSLTINGSIATNKPYGFSYTDGPGYGTQNISYDENLATDPPPYFPELSGTNGSGGSYKMVSWRELLH